MFRRRVDRNALPTYMSTARADDDCGPCKGERCASTAKLAHVAAKTSHKIAISSHSDVARRLSPIVLYAVYFGLALAITSGFSAWVRADDALPNERRLLLSFCLISALAMTFAAYLTANRKGLWSAMASTRLLEMTLRKGKHSACVSVRLGVDYPGRVVAARSLPEFRRRIPCTFSGRDVRAGSGVESGSAAARVLPGLLDDDQGRQMDVTV